MAIAIDRSDADNGTVEVLPGSHADGLVEHTRIGQGYGIPDHTYQAALRSPRPRAGDHGSG